MNFIKTKFHYTNPVVQLFLIITVAIIVRIYFFNGIVFSDDTYYDFLGLSITKGHYAQNYLGYPIFLLRKLQSLLTALSFSVLGINQIASIAAPFLFSIAGIIVAYFLSFEFTNSRRIAILTSLLLAFFPSDIIFATINFTDLQSAFFINLGLLFLIRSVKSQSSGKSIIAGFLFFTSLLLKENIYFILILLTLLMIYYFKNKNVSYKYIFISLLAFSVLLFFEAIYYSAAMNDFFYRLHTLNANYQFCSYDFFPNTIVANPNNAAQLFAGLMKQIFLLNTKYFFLRRFYLFLPLIALGYSFYLIKRKEQKLLIFWFLGLAILMIGFTTSFTDYKPLDLRRNYYIFTALLPAIILTASLLSKIRIKLLFFIISIYIISSFIMSRKYQSFFDVKINQRFIEFVKANEEKTIYTDHHTAYGLYVISSRFENKNIKIFTNEMNIQLQANSLVIYNKDEIEELEKQKFIFPKLNEMNKGKLKLINEFGKFSVFTKLKNKANK